MWCEAGVQLHSVACGCPTVPAQFIGETVLSPLMFLGVLAKSQLNTNLEVYILDSQCCSVDLPVYSYANTSLLITVALY